MIGVENGLRHTAVLWGCEVKRLFCIRSRSVSVSDCSYVVVVVQLALGYDRVGGREDGASGPIILLEVYRLGTRELFI